MKIKTNAKTDKVFEPIEVTITVEDENDLRYLWHLFYMSTDCIKDSYDNFDRNYIDIKEKGYLWSTINDVANYRRVKIKK